MPKFSERLANADHKARYVRTLFARIADRYDLITVVLSYGRDAAWKRRLVAMAHVAAGTRALDLATGTGDIAFLLGARGARIVGLDVTLRMIELARAKRGIKEMPLLLVGDMMTLPFPEGSFDLVTTGYGLRNVPDLGGALAEIHRVLQRGGELLALDFNRPANAFIRTLYLAYLWLVGGAVGWILHGDPDTYRYIPASIRLYPGAPAVAGLMRACGFSVVSHYPVLGGLMAIHHARK
jgi:demethylmenaquinone methyltransferase/2-methoxy-6-polyprenyl-1,4-benzoquinol methylase